MPNTMAWHLDTDPVTNEPQFGLSVRHTLRHGAGCMQSWIQDWGICQRGNSVDEVFHYWSLNPLSYLAFRFFFCLNCVIGYALHSSYGFLKHTTFGSHTRRIFNPRKQAKKPPSKYLVSCSKGK